jgi:hypothetical protein
VLLAVGVVSFLPAGVEMLWARRKKAPRTSLARGAAAGVRPRS